MGKVVLITGASAGMGKETAKLLANKGYIVYGVARRLENMDDLKQFGVKTLKMDVTDEESLTTTINKIIALEGKIDILINNAGFGSYGAIEDVSIPDAKYQLDVNVFAVARLIQLVLPYMREQKWGKIVNISSIGGKMAIPFGGWYHASKFALEGMSDSLRNEVKQFGIDVIVIEPGGVKTEWGNIAYDNLMKNTVNSAYSDLANKFGNAFKRTENKNANPIVIAKLIQEGIESKSPKTRYVGGYLAKPTMLFLKFMTDKMLDKIILSQAK